MHSSSLTPSAQDPLNHPHSGQAVFSADYSFCKFRIPVIGGRVIWEVTNECNYACSYCIFSSTGKKPIGELTTEQIFKAIDELKEHNFNHIKFTGGEPFLRPDMIDILRYAKSLGINCDISTNASLITPLIAQQLKDLNLDMVHVSVDGSNIIEHESVRGKKSYDKTLAGLSLLKSAQVQMRIGCVIHKNNQDNLSAMIDFAQSYNAKEIIFSMMEIAGRLKPNSNLLATRCPQSLIEEIKRIQNTKFYNIKISHNLSSLIAPLPSSVKVNSSIKIASAIDDGVANQEKVAAESVNKSFCPGGTKFLFINSLGQVSPCTWVSDKKPEFLSFSIVQQNLKTILNSSKFLELKSLAQRHINECPAPSLSAQTQEQVIAFTHPNKKASRTHVTMLATNL